MSIDLKEIVQDKYGEAARRVRTGERTASGLLREDDLLRGRGVGILRPDHIPPVRRRTGR